MTEHYRRIFDDWDRSIQRQAKILDSSITRGLLGRPLNILDCACGIGSHVAALDNALPHLTSGLLIEAIQAMAAKLNSGGLFIARIRD